jgi:hypothetical protein
MLRLLQWWRYSNSVFAQHFRPTYVYIQIVLLHGSGVLAVADCLESFTCFVEETVDVDQVVLDHNAYPMPFANSMSSIHLSCTPPIH